MKDRACFGCEDRKTGCHSGCVEYKADAILDKAFCVKDATADQIRYITLGRLCSETNKNLKAGRFCREKADK